MLVSLIYAQLTKADSLRVLEQSFNTHSNQHYHLGTIQKGVTYFFDKGYYDFY